MFSDPFTRPDSGDPGADWTVIAGTWSILGNKLNVAAGSGSQIKCNRTIPSDVGTGTGTQTGGLDHFLVYIDIGFTADNDIARMYFDNGQGYVEIQRLTATQGRIRLYAQPDVGTWLPFGCYASRDIPLYGTNTLTLCVDGNVVHATLGGGDLITVPYLVSSSVMHLGASCSGNVTFDNLVISKHYYDLSSCPQCRNEQCAWFLEENSITYGALPSLDYYATVGTGTGTAGAGGYWFYGYGIFCSANSALRFWPHTPRGPIGGFAVNGLQFFTLQTATVRLYWDDSSACLKIQGGGSAGTVTAVGEYDGVEYGLKATVGSGFFICWDGTSFNCGCASVGLSTSLPYVPVGNMNPRIEVTGFTNANDRVVVTSIAGYKDGAQTVPPIGTATAACGVCVADPCANCAKGTIPNQATLSLSGFTQRYAGYYDCPACPGVVGTGSGTFSASPFVISLAYGQPLGVSPPSGVSGCQWAGVCNAPFYGGSNCLPFYARDNFRNGCFNSPLWAWATVSQVAGGYKMTVEVYANVILSLYQTVFDWYAKFEETIVAGTPPDCTTAWGDIPLVYSYLHDSVNDNTMYLWLCDNSSLKVHFKTPP